MVGFGLEIKLLIFVVFGVACSGGLNETEFSTCCCLEKQTIYDGVRRLKSGTMTQ